MLITPIWWSFCNIYKYTIILISCVQHNSICQLYLHKKMIQTKTKSYHTKKIQSA